MTNETTDSTTTKEDLPETAAEAVEEATETGGGQDQQRSVDTSSDPDELVAKDQDKDLDDILGMLDEIQKKTEEKEKGAPSLDGDEAKKRSQRNTLTQETNEEQAIEDIRKPGGNLAEAIETGVQVGTEGLAGAAQADVYEIAVEDSQKRQSPRKHFDRAAAEKAVRQEVKKGNPLHYSPKKVSGEVVYADDGVIMTKLKDGSVALHKAPQTREGEMAPKPGDRVTVEASREGTVVTKKLELKRGVPTPGIPVKKERSKPEKAAGMER